MNPFSCFPHPISFPTSTWSHTVPPPLFYLTSNIVSQSLYVYPFHSSPSLFSIPYFSPHVSCPAYNYHDPVLSHPHSSPYVSNSPCFPHDVSFLTHNIMIPWCPSRRTLLPHVPSCFSSSPPVLADWSCLAQISRSARWWAPRRRTSRVWSRRVRWTVVWFSCNTCQARSPGSDTTGNHTLHP